MVCNWKKRRIRKSLGLSTSKVSLRHHPVPHCWWGLTTGLQMAPGLLSTFQPLALPPKQGAVLAAMVHIHWQG